ncbi:hypothetical protein TNCV_1792341 [Trichonephila clavipes]|nr:hypothetical protein TNCV_1792341 [Trichonephila clavipes]
MKLPGRLINTTNERYSRTRGYETTPQRVKGDIEDVSIELDNEFQRLYILDETTRILLLSILEFHHLMIYIFINKLSKRRGWFVASLLHLRLRVRSRPKSEDFHDAEN